MPQPSDQIRGSSAPTSPNSIIANRLYPIEDAPEAPDAKTPPKQPVNEEDDSLIDFSNMENGFVNDDRVIKKQIQNIEHAPMGDIGAITLHQTNSPTAQSTLNGWQTRKEGAHFLIGEDGTIYQVASLDKQTWHVGQLQSRCVNEKRCTDDEWQYYNDLEDKYRNQDSPNWADRAREIHAHEIEKDFPDRYPLNSESVGIEVVGKPDKNGVYPAPNAAQAASLKILVASLRKYYGIEDRNVLRHGQTGTRPPSECAKCNP